MFVCVCVFSFRGPHALCYNRIVTHGTHIVGFAKIGIGSTIKHVAGFQRKARSKVAHNGNIFALGIVFLSNHEPQHEIFLRNGFTVLKACQIKGCNGPCHLESRIVAAKGFLVVVQRDRQVGVGPRPGTANGMSHGILLFRHGLVKLHVVGPGGAPCVRFRALHRNEVHVPHVDGRFGRHACRVHVPHGVVGDGGGFGRSRRLGIGAIGDGSRHERVVSANHIEVGLDGDQLIVQKTIGGGRNALSERRRIDVSRF
mmetsp:Transcript_32502/g.49722  ORF Transcript_32502/g.49722 Transcript_32502/m.49722 type:complete len:256 (+) Transcript_32502:166-933(+)